MNRMCVREIFAVLSVAAVGMAAELPVGERFPELKGKLLTGQQAALPAAASGRIALVAVGFKPEARSAASAWASRFRREFGEAPAFFEVPMIDGKARFARWAIDRTLRGATAPSDRGQVLTVYGETLPWKERLGIKPPEVAGVVLLDGSGVVRWRHVGDLDETAFRSLGAAMRQITAR